MKKQHIVFFFCLFVLEGYSQHLPSPYGLTTTYLRAPSQAVITDSTPNFAWIFPQSGIKQSAYRILVASSPFMLEEGDADLWDSGVVRDHISVNVTYQGKPLTVNSTYWWQVKVWSPDGLESNYSQPQQFNTGNFDRSGLDYPGQSKWIELSADHWVSEDKQCASFHRYDR